MNNIDQFDDEKPLYSNLFEQQVVCGIWTKEPATNFNLYNYAARHLSHALKCGQITEHRSSAAQWRERGRNVGRSRAKLSDMRAHTDMPIFGKLESYNINYLILAMIFAPIEPRAHIHLFYIVCFSTSIVRHNISSRGLLFALASCGQWIKDIPFKNQLHPQKEQQKTDTLSGEYRKMGRIKSKRLYHS